MKKPAFFTIIALILLVVTLIHQKGFSSASGKIRVAVTVLPQAYFVERVGGARVNAQVMIPPGACPETYEPTPQQLVRLSDADIYLKVGAPALPFENKYLRLIAGTGRKMTVVNMSQGTRYRERDPHVWVSPSAVKIAARNIYQALSLYDPEYRDYYKRNLTAFLSDIERLDSKNRRLFAGMGGYAFLVYHPAWGYFADEYGLKQMAIEEEGKIKGASHIKDMIDMARRKGIKIIFVQKGFDTKSAGTIAREIGGKVIEADPLQRDWLKGMEVFAEALRQALKK